MTRRRASTGRPPYGVWIRSLLEPRKRLLPGLGHRLGHHPRIAVPVLTGLRHVPGRRARTMLYRSVSRPLAERMDGQLVVPVRRGVRMEVDMTDMMGRVLATSGVWEPHVTAVLPRLLRSGDVFVDVGAHVGYHALLASKIVGPVGSVYALEPSHATFDVLRANLELNGVTNVRALCIAVGAHEGSGLVVEPPPGNTGEASVRALAEGEEVGVAVDAERVTIKPLWALLDQTDIARLRLVKIDVEGFEADVLGGAEPVLASGGRPSLVVEVHPHAAEETVRALEHIVRSHGYEASELVRLPRRDRFAEVPAPRAIPDLGLVAERCSGSTMNVLLTPHERLGTARPT